MRFNQVLVALILTGLVSCKCNIDKPGSKNTAQQVNIVLCDLTRSLDGTSIDSIANHAALLLVNTVNYTDWYFYGIGETDYNEAIFEYKTKSAARTTTTEDSIYGVRLKESSETLKGKILLLYQNNNYQRTCITHALKTAFDKIREKKEQNPTLKFNIILLSDLLEICDHPILGHIVLNSPQNLKNSIRNVDLKDSTVIDLKRLGAAVYIVAESRNTASKTTKSDLETAWRVILKKYGYEVDDSDVRFNWLSLPERFLKQ